MDAQLFLVDRCTGMGFLKGVRIRQGKNGNLDSYYLDMIKMGSELSILMPKPLYQEFVNFLQQGKIQLKSI